MLLSSKNVGAGDTRRVTISYDDFLAKGETISTIAVTAAVTIPPAISSIGSGGLAPSRFLDERAIVFYVLAASINEKFTVDIQITTSLSQIVNDTITFTVVAP